MYKYYRYNSKSDTDYKLTVGKTNFNYFKSIVYEGFKILSPDTDIYTIDFEIEPQVFRKIKLKQIDNKLNSVERKIIQLLERSKIKESTFGYNNANNYSYSNFSFTNSNTSEDYEYINDQIIDKETQKDRNKYQQKVNNHKAKQYESKTRIRK